MKPALLYSVLIMMPLFSGCTSQALRHPQCGQYDFASCLGVTAPVCDGMYDKAVQTCNRTIEDNSMISSMPENIKQKYVNRCLLNSLVGQSGKPEADVKSCIKWE